MGAGPTRLLAGLVLAFVGALVLRETASLTVPVIFGLFLALSASPLIGTFARRGAPREVAVSCAVGVILAILVAFVVLLGVSMAQLVAILPRYADRLTMAADDLEAFLSGFGITIDSTALPATVTPGMLASLGQSIVAAVSRTATALLIVAFTLGFALSSGASLRERARSILGAGHPLLDGLVEFGADLRRYLVVRAQLGLFAAVLSLAWLVVLGVPLPVLWALLVFAASFVPNVGMIVALVPPAILGILDGGVGAGVGVVVGFTLINLAQDYVLQPRLMGTEFNLSALVVFLSIVTWSWILGAAGALLAVPLTVGLLAVLEALPQSRAVASLLRGSVGPASPRLGDESARAR